MGKLFYLSPNNMILVADCINTELESGAPASIDITTFDSIHMDYSTGFGSPPKFTAELTGEHTCRASDGLSGLLQLVTEMYVKEQVQSALSASSESGNRRTEERIASLQSSLEKAERKITRLGNRQKRTAKKLSPLFASGSPKPRRVAPKPTEPSIVVANVAGGNYTIPIRSIRKVRPYNGTHGSCKSVVECVGATYYTCEDPSYISDLIAAAFL